jgi:hypothetical protein
MSVTPVTISGNGTSTAVQDAQAEEFQALIQDQYLAVIQEDPADKSAAQQLVNKADHTTSTTTLTQIENQMNNLLLSASQQRAELGIVSSNSTTAPSSTALAPQYSYDLAIANGISPSRLGSSS